MPLLFFAGGGRPERRFVDFVYQPVRAADGAVIAIFVEGTDVTERQFAGEQLRRSEAWNRQILDAATDHAIIALDPDGQVTRWNAGAEAILGWTEAEMVGRSASCIFDEEERCRSVGSRDARRRRGRPRGRRRMAGPQVGRAVLGERRDHADPRPRASCSAS